MSSREQSAALIFLTHSYARMRSCEENKAVLIDTSMKIKPTRRREKTEAGETRWGGERIVAKQKGEKKDTDRKKRNRYGLMLIFLIHWQSCSPLSCQRSVSGLNLALKENRAWDIKKDKDVWWAKECRKIMRTCPSISPHNSHFTMMEMFPKQDDGNKWHQHLILCLHFPPVIPLFPPSDVLPSFLLLPFLYPSFPLPFFLHLLTISVSMC